MGSQCLFANKAGLFRKYAWEGKASKAAENLTLRICFERARLPAAPQEPKNQPRLQPLRYRLEPSSILRSANVRRTVSTHASDGHRRHRSSSLRPEETAGTGQGSRRKHSRVQGSHAPAARRKT